MRDYIYEEKLRNLFIKLLDKQTLYMHIGHMYDLTVYIPDEMLVEGIEDKVAPNPRLCMYRHKYFRGAETWGDFVCEKIQKEKNLEWRQAVYFYKDKLISGVEYYDKRKEIFEEYPPDQNNREDSFDRLKLIDNIHMKRGYTLHHNVWLDIKTNQVFPYEAKFREVECIGWNCGMHKTYREVRAEKKGTDYYLERGLHLFEFKSNQDKVHKFLQQLPHYVFVFPEYIWLVVGDKTKVPPNLPTWVGVFKQRGEGFELIKRPYKISYGMLSYKTPLSKRDKLVLEILSDVKILFLHSLFGKEIIESNELDSLLSTFKEQLDQEVKKYV